MSKWSGASYQGPVDNDWEQGLGKHKFPNGVIYDGLLDKGEFHGEGTLIYPNGVSCFFLFRIRDVTLQSGTEENLLKENTFSTIT